MRSVPSIAISALAILGCASTDSHTDSSVGLPAEVRFYDSRTGLHMAIVNDSHLAQLGVEGESPDDRRLAFYSAIRGGAGPKVTTDEILEGLIGYLDDQGFERLAASGPLSEGESGTISIEVVTGLAARHAVRTKGMSLADAESFNALVLAFYQTYNAIPQYQAYDGQPAEELFQSPEPPGRGGTGRD